MPKQLGVGNDGKIFTKDFDILGRIIKTNILDDCFCEILIKDM